MARKFQVGDEATLRDDVTYRVTIYHDDDMVVSTEAHITPAGSSVTLFSKAPSWFYVLDRDGNEFAVEDGLLVPV